jgi:hypothetical protein
MSKKDDAIKSNNMPDDKKTSFKFSKKLVLFNDKDVTKLVKSFAEGWLRGEVKINFPTAHEISKSVQPNSEFKGFIYFNDTLEEAKYAELSQKQYFMKLIKTVCDSGATEVEQEKAIASLFELLMAFRCGQRIDGVFKDDSLEKIKTLEKRISAMDRVLKELIIALNSHDHKRN